MINAIRLKEWIICGNCGCKLAGANKETVAKQLFIKCHSCKDINNIQVGDNDAQKE